MLSTRAAHAPEIIILILKENCSFFNEPFFQLFIEDIKYRHVHWHYQNTWQQTLHKVSRSLVPYYITEHTHHTP